MKAFDDATFVLYGLSEYTVWDAIINYKTFAYTYVSYIAYIHFTQPYSTVLKPY